VRRVLLPLLLSGAVVLPAAAWSGLPEHLELVGEELAAAGVPALVPPDRPPGTTATVGEAERHFYTVLFTNDPEGTLAHAEQVNVFVTGTDEPTEPVPDARPVDVRGGVGAFFCGAAACFLDWREGGTTYSVGEFGSPEDAVSFAESLVPLEEVAGAIEPDPSPSEPQGEGVPFAVIALLSAGAALVVGAVLVWRSKRA
jgi:hypothetical protein